MTKKLLALVLAVMIAMTVFPVTVFAYIYPESDHPYADDADESWDYIGKSTTKSVSITFSDDTETEENYDYIVIQDTKGNLLGRFSGRQLSGKTVSYNVNSFTIILVSDGSATYYGFKVTNITENNYTVKEASVVGGNGISVNEDKENGTLTFSGTGDLKFDVVGNVDWVKTIVVEEGITRLNSSFNSFKNVEKFKLADGISNVEYYYFNSTAFYNNQKNWDVDALYIDNYLIESKSCRYLAVKDGTKSVSGIYGVDEAFIPESVIYINGCDSYTDYLCSKDSYAYNWAVENDYNVYTPGSLKVEYTNPIVNVGTTLGSAINLYSLSSDFEWKTVTGIFTSRGYSAKKTGKQNVTVSYNGESVDFEIAVSSANVQYINFNDSVLRDELRSCNIDINEDGMISVEELKKYDGYISLYKVKDLSGLEYADNAMINDVYYCRADSEEIFSLQKYEDVQLPVSLCKHMSMFGRLYYLYDSDDNDYYSYYLPSDFKYSSSDSSVAYVKDDMLYLNKVGEAVITVACGSVSKQLNVKVYDTDEPVNGVSDNIPELNSLGIINYNNDIYHYGRDGSFKKLADNQKAVLSTVYGARYQNIYSGIYYITENDELWFCEDFTDDYYDNYKLGDGFVKVDGCLGLDSHGHCYDLITMELLMSGVTDITNNSILTANGDLYFYDGEEIILADTKISKIISSRHFYESNEALCMKNDGTIRRAFKDDLSKDLLPADKKVKDIGVYRGMYYYTDSDNNLWSKYSGDSSEIFVSSSVKYIVKPQKGYMDYDYGYPLGFVTENDDLYLVAEFEKNGNKLPDTPFAQNVKKVGSTCYLTNDNELYVAFEGNINNPYIVSREPDKENNMFKLMSDVVDFADDICYYENSDYCYAKKILFTRVDGSIWSYNTVEHKLEQVLEGNAASHSHTYTHIVVPSTCKVQGMEYDLCTQCGETANSKVLPLAAHTWSEWKTVSEATTEKAGLMKRECSVCGKAETKEIPKLNVIKDSKTGIEIVYSDQYDTGVTIKVTEEFDGKSFQLINTSFGENQAVIYDITTMKDGKAVQPSGKVTVKIPIPEKFKGNNTFVCYIDSVNNKVVKIPATVKDGYVWFEVDHFSRYAVVEANGRLNGVKVDDISLNYKKSAKLTPKIDADEGVKYTVSYKSSDPKVASVDKDGNVKALKRGNTTITVTVTDQYGNEVKDACNVTVKYTFLQWLIKVVLFGWIWY